MPVSMLNVRLKSVLVVAALAMALSGCGSAPTVPVANVQVKLIKPPATAASSSKRTDAKGEIDFGKLKKGKYTVTPVMPVKAPAGGTAPTKVRVAATVIVMSGKDTLVSKEVSITGDGSKGTIDLPKVTFSADGENKIVVTIKA